VSQKEGGTAPASFTDVTEGALDRGDVDLEAWPAQSPEGLTHTVWLMYMRSTDSVSHP
jgi:hypothetical protein